ncbi:MAG: efflux RND transporter periplasmic adaptor subunit [Myxococcales bacterium]|nr:efflux RND transporter periplasmic adaptor subunit [Myxococcales bacterium]
MSDQLSSDLASLRIDRTPAASAPSPWRKAVAPVVVVGALATGGWFGWQQLQPRIYKQEVRTSEIAMLSPSQAEVTVTSTGYVIPQRTSKVGSKVPGRLAKVLVKEGDIVKEGQVIAQLEDADQRSAVTAAGSRVGVASARISAAKAQLAEVSQQVAREKALVAKGAVGRANLENLEAREASLREAVRAAEAETRAAQAEVGTFHVGLQDRAILSPMNGRIVGKPAAVGEYVGGIAGIGAVAEIIDFDSLLVETDVPEARLHLLLKGPDKTKLDTPCEIVLDAYPNKRYRGVAVALGQRVNRAKATVVVKVRFADDIEGVLPEMSARVSFLTKAITDDALKEAPKKVIPAEAVATRGDQKVVFTVDGDKLQQTPIKVGGAVGAGMLEVLDGPTPGTKVVMNPSAETADGQRIKETDK